MRGVFLAFSVAAFLPIAGIAQPTCTNDMRRDLHKAGITAGFEAIAGRSTDGNAPSLSFQEVIELGNATMANCGQDRVSYGLVMALMLGASGTMDQPEQRQHLLASAFRTAGALAAAKAAAFEPMDLATSEPWTVEQERKTYGRLMLALRDEHRETGVFSELYTEGQMEQIGCGLYPDSEILAYADEILVGSYEHDEVGRKVENRVAFLASLCDDPDRRVSGLAAKYYADVALSEAYHLAEGETNAVLERTYRSARIFLMKHLDGATESDLWSAKDAAFFLDG